MEFLNLMRREPAYSSVAVLPLALTVVLVLSTAGCNKAETVSLPGRPQASPEKDGRKASPEKDWKVVGKQVEHFCGACHASPSPASFPRDRWIHEVQRGYEFYLLSGRTDLSIPRQSDVVQYYQSLAPEHLPLPDSPAAESPSRFTLAEYAWATHDERAPSTAHILSLPDSPHATAGSVAVCDMGRGTIEWLATGKDRIQTLQRQTMANPDHICPTDLDADGEPDFLVSDLGSFLPEDHQRGRVVWLKPA